MAQTADKLTVGIPHWPFPNRRFHTKQQLDYIILSDDERKRTSIFSFCNNADKLERISKRQLFRFSVRNPLRKFYRFSLNFFRSRYNRDLHVFCLQYYRSASCQFVLICISRYRSTDHFSCCTIGNPDECCVPISVVVFFARRKCEGKSERFSYRNSLLWIKTVGRYMSDQDKEFETRKQSRVHPRADLFSLRIPSWCVRLEKRRLTWISSKPTRRRQQLKVSAMSSRRNIVLILVVLLILAAYWTHRHTYRIVSRDGLRP